MIMIKKKIFFFQNGKNKIIIIPVNKNFIYIKIMYIHAKFIIIWACNSVSTNLHHWHIIKEAQKNGSKVVVIDAYASKTAKEADWHICPKPGTDGALAMAMMNVIIAITQTVYP